MRNALFIFIILIFILSSSKTYSFEGATPSHLTVRYFKAKYQKRLPGNPLRHQYTSITERLASLKDFEIDRQELRRISDYDKVYYNSDFNVIKIEMYSKNTMIKYITFKYNEYGNETEMRTYNTQRQLIGIWEYNYDKYGNRTEAILYDKYKRHIEEKWFYYYTDKGTLTKIEEIFKGGIPRSIYYYDDREDVFKVENYSNWKLKVIYYYSRNAVLQRVERYSTARNIAMIEWYNHRGEKHRVDFYDKDGNYLRSQTKN